MKMSVLNAEDLQQVHEATLDILENGGVWFKDSPEAEDVFRRNGCRVDSGRVRIPRELFAECVERLPNRDDLEICVTKLGFSDSLRLRRAESHVGVIGNPYYIHEHGKGARDLTETDADDKFLLVDSLSNLKYDFCCTINASQRNAEALFPDYRDIDVCLAYLRRRLAGGSTAIAKKPAIHANLLHASEENPRELSPRTRKPLDRMEVLRHAILYGPAETGALLAKDTPLVWCNPISPLQYHPEQVREISEAIKAYGLSCYVMFSPEVMLGATGPVTIAGALAQHNAEVMSGVILTQLLQPGTRTIYGSVSGVMDLRKADISLGSLESQMFGVGVVQLADHYGLPSRVQFGNTSARSTGARAAAETAWGLQMGMAAGANFVNTGLLDSTLMLSLEHLVVVDELVNQIRGATRATIVDRERLAADVLREEGRPGGNYMGHEHTLDRMKEGMYYSDFSGRVEQSYEDWYDTAHRKIDEILQNGRDAAAADTSVNERCNAVAARLREDRTGWLGDQPDWWRPYVQDLG